MRDANIVVLSGNLARDPELRYTTSGQAVANFTVAVSKGKDKNGDDLGADFIQVTAWGKQAENIDRYLSKGAKVIVTGSLRVDSYESESGRKYRTYVNASQVQFISTKRNRDNDDLAHMQEKGSGYMPETEAFGEQDVEIPF